MVIIFAKLLANDCTFNGIQLWPYNTTDVTRGGHRHQLRLEILLRHREVLVE